MARFSPRRTTISRTSSALVAAYILPPTTIRVETPAPSLQAGVRVPLPHDFSLYGGLGYQFFEDPNEFEQFTWTAGISYYWKTLTFDVRYWGTDLSDDECIVRSGFSDGCDSRIVATLSFTLHGFEGAGSRGNDSL